MTPNATLALDVSKYQGEISVAQWRAAKAAGYGLAIVGAWHGSDANPHCEPTLANARSIGMSTAIYVVLTAAMSSRDSLAAGFAAAGARLPATYKRPLAFVALDMELDAIGQNSMDAAENSLRSCKVPGIVYTRGSWWTEKVPELTTSLPLWTAAYDGQADLYDPALPYGPWDHATGKQYSSNIRIDVGADRFVADGSVFRADWWAR